MSAPTRVRRKRCSRCGELRDPAELTEVGHDRLCESCLDTVAAELPDADDEEHGPPGDPELADAISGAADQVEAERIPSRAVQARRAADSAPLPSGDAPLKVFGIEHEDRGGLAFDALPAPSVQHDAPMPDLRDEDEKEEQPERRWNLPDWDVPGWPLRRGRISASALGSFARCPEQFRRKYVLGERDRWGPAGIVGTGIHKALARAYIYRMAQGERMPTELGYEAFEEYTAYAYGREEERYGGVDWGHDGSRAKRAMDEESWRSRGRQVIDTYMAEVEPSVGQPIGAEESFVVSIPGVPVPVVGFIDLVTLEEMVDYKFGQKRSFQVSPEWRIQGLTYLLARDLPMTWHSMNWSGEWASPLTEPGLQLPNSFENYTIATDLVAAMVRGVLGYATAFGRDEPWPGNVAHTWACGTCYFREQAPEQCAWWHRDTETDVL